MIASLWPAKLTYTVAWVQAHEHAFVYYTQGTLFTCFAAHRTERSASWLEHDAMLSTCTAYLHGKHIHINALSTYIRTT